MGVPWYPFLTQSLDVRYSGKGVSLGKVTLQLRQTLKEPRGRGCPLTTLSTLNPKSFLTGDVGGTSPPCLQHSLSCFKFPPSTCHLPSTLYIYVFIYCLSMQLGCEVS